MIIIFIKSYFFLLLAIGVSSVAAFVFGLFFIFKSNKKTNKPDEDLTAISGDDVLSTQLDLARAYIETGSKQLAADILKMVVKQGNVEQQKEARTLLVNI